MGPLPWQKSQRCTIETQKWLARRDICRLCRIPRRRLAGGVDQAGNTSFQNSISISSLNAPKVQRIDNTMQPTAKEVQTSSAKVQLHDNLVYCFDKKVQGNDRLVQGIDKEVQGIDTVRRRFDTLVQDVDTGVQRPAKGLQLHDRDMCCVSEKNTALTHYSAALSCMPGPL